MVKICTKVVFTVHQSFSHSFHSTVLGKISQSNMFSVCSGSLDHSWTTKFLLIPGVRLDQFTLNACVVTVTSLSGINK